MSIPYNQANAGENPTTNSVRKFYIEDDFTTKDIIGLVEQHIANSATYDKLYNYYKGNQSIQNRNFNDHNKPNNKIVNNFCKLVVDTSASFLMSEPVTYTSKNKATLKAIKEVLDANNVNNVNLEEAKLSAIMGHVFEIHWIGEQGHRFKQISAEHCFIAYSMDVEETPLVACNYKAYTMLDGTKRRRVEIYTRETFSTISYDYIAEAKATNDAYQNIKYTDVIPHNFGELPVIEIVANDERLGDFEGAMSIQDAYNLVQSDTANDINYWNDAYLHFDGLELTEDDDIADMKNDRVFVTPPSPAGSTSIRFITKEVNDKHLENFKSRLSEDFFRFTQTADVSGSNFTASSGVAIKYRTQTLENKTSIKEVKFKDAMKKRHRLIAHTINLPKDSSKYLDPDIISVTFTRNLPASLTELSDMIVKLQGIVSNETLIGTIPFVEDVAGEQALVSKEAESAIMRTTGVPVAQQANTKLDNNPDASPAVETNSTMTATSAKAKQAARTKKPLNQPKAT